MDPIEKLSIETPEQIELEFPVAGLGSRGLALFIDSLLQLIVVIVVIALVELISPDLSRYWVTAGKWMTAAAIFFLFCLYWGYFAIFEALWNGQTPGKRQAHIRVITGSGRPVNAFESMARNFLRAVDSQLFYIVGAIAIAVDKNNRRLGDMVAGTVVVHELQEQGDSYWYRHQSSVTTKPSVEAINGMTAQEFQLIETFLNRRLDLPYDQRVKVAIDIASRIGDRLSVPPADRGTPEDFLEELSRRYRDAARFR
ncbi:MAG: RDD family protein [Terriglobales bacterium]